MRQRLGPSEGSEIVGQREREREREVGGESERTLGSPIPSMSSDGVRSEDVMGVVESHPPLRPHTTPHITPQLQQKD